MTIRAYHDVGTVAAVRVPIGTDQRVGARLGAGSDHLLVAHLSVVPGRQIHRVRAEGRHPDDEAVDLLASFTLRGLVGSAPAR